MRTYSVVVAHVPVDAGYHLPGCNVLVDVDIFVFQAAKKALCTDIVQRLAFAVHGYPYIIAFHQVQVGLVGEVTTLVRVDDLGSAIAKCNSLTDLSLPGSVEMPRIAQYNA